MVVHLRFATAEGRHGCGVPPPNPQHLGLCVIRNPLSGSALLCQTYDFTFTGHYVKCYNSNLTLSNICCKNCTPWRQSMKKAKVQLFNYPNNVFGYKWCFSYKYMFCVGSQIKQKKDCRRIKSSNHHYSRPSGAFQSFLCVHRLFREIFKN